jgi:hypothetical protein
MLSAAWYSQHGKQSDPGTESHSQDTCAPVLEVFFRAAGILDDKHKLRNCLNNWTSTELTAE